jgi:hypothetical protein
MLAKHFLGLGKLIVEGFILFNDACLLAIGVPHPE